MANPLTVPALTETPGNVPRFAHDCDDCYFVGRVDVDRADRCESYDVWVCPRDESAILRFDSDGPAYRSMPISMMPQICTRGWAKAYYLIREWRQNVARLFPVGS